MSRSGPCRPPTGACRPRGTPWTNRSTSRRRCLRGGKAPRCSPRRAVLPVQCGSFLQPSTAGVSDAECSSELVLPELCPARISVSSSLLAATMNQKSSLREDPNFVSWALTANMQEQADSFVVQSLEDAEQVGESSTDPVHRPRCDHVELFRVHRLHHGIESRALIPALRTADASILIDLDDLPAGSLSDRLQLATLIISRLLIGGNSEIDGDALHGDLLPKKQHYDIPLYCNHLIYV